MLEMLLGGHAPNFFMWTAHTLLLYVPPSAVGPSPFCPSRPRPLRSALRGGAAPSSNPQPRRTGRPALLGFHRCLAGWPSRLPSRGRAVAGEQTAEQSNWASIRKAGHWLSPLIVSGFGTAIGLTRCTSLPWWSSVIHIPFLCYEWSLIWTLHQTANCIIFTEVFFSSENILILDIVTLSFLFDNYCPIID